MCLILSRDQRGLVHAKLNDLYAAVDDVTEAFKLQRKNATYKQHMGDLAQKLAQHIAVKCVLRRDTIATGFCRGAQQPLVILRWLPDPHYACALCVNCRACEQWAARRGEPTVCRRGATSQRNPCGDRANHVIVACRYVHEICCSIGIVALSVNVRLEELSARGSAHTGAPVPRRRRATRDRQGQKSLQKPEAAALCSLHVPWRSVECPLSVCRRSAGAPYTCLCHANTAGWARYQRMV